MFIVLLKFSENKAQAKEYMEGHNAWISKGFSDGIFIMVGSIEPASGGCIMAHNTSLEELRARVAQDPFVVENVVDAEIVEVSPKRTDDRLAFLVG